MRETTAVTMKRPRDISSPFRTVAGAAPSREPARSLIAGPRRPGWRPGGATGRARSRARPRRAGGGAAAGPGQRRAWSAATPAPPLDQLPPAAVGPALAGLAAEVDALVVVVPVWPGVGGGLPPPPGRCGGPSGGSPRRRRRGSSRGSSCGGAAGTRAWCWGGRAGRAAGGAAGGGALRLPYPHLRRPLAPDVVHVDQREHRARARADRGAGVDRADRAVGVDRARAAAGARGAGGARERAARDRRGGVDALLARVPAAARGRAAAGAVRGQLRVRRELAGRVGPVDARAGRGVAAARADLDVLRRGAVERGRGGGAARRRAAGADRGRHRRRAGRAPAGPRAEAAARDELGRPGAARHRRRARGVPRGVRARRRRHVRGPRLRGEPAGARGRGRARLAADGYDARYWPAFYPAHRLGRSCRRSTCSSRRSAARGSGSSCSTRWRAGCRWSGRGSGVRPTSSTTPPPTWSRTGSSPCGRAPTPRCLALGNWPLWAETAAADVAARLRECRDDPAELARRGEAARGVAARFTWERTARAIVASVERRRR